MLLLLKLPSDGLVRSPPRRLLIRSWQLKLRHGLQQHAGSWRVPHLPSGTMSRNISKPL